MASVVQGARYPNAIESSFALHGEAAAKIAGLFGLTSENSQISLKLGGNTSWAVYLLKQDTPKRLSNSQGQPDRYNLLQFTLGPQPSLSIGPFWEDLATALPNNEPGRYRISSDDINMSLSGNDPWTQLLKKLITKAEWKGQCKRERPTKLFSQTYIDKQGSNLSLHVWCHESFPNNVSTLMYRTEILFEQEKAGK